MVFKAKYAEENFRLGDMRTERHFAWLPIRIKDDYLWLETYETLMYYEAKQFPVFGTDKAITVHEWVKIADKRIPKLQITIKSDQ
jgi:hypothetical protein